MEPLSHSHFPSSEVVVAQPPTKEEERIYTVSALTRSIREAIESSLGPVWVEGEISNYRRQSSGHHYFTLKDETSQLDCVLFRGLATSSGAKNALSLLGDGVQVRLFGKITVYELRGRYQLVVELIQPCGQGSLQARFEALKRKLFAEGLFDQSLKKKLPRFPRAIAIVTSPTGAALQDMLQILQRRAPWLPIVICPVRVQGKGAAHEIADALDHLNERVQEAALSLTQLRVSQIDLVVLARGGGSIEDLWEFNEEIVARAVVASELPVVSAVGHEIDFTIVDFVSDLRAPTPSAAAELIVPETTELQRQLLGVQELLKRRLVNWVTRTKQILTSLSERAALKRAPAHRLLECKQQLDGLENDLSKLIKRLLQTRQERLDQITIERLKDTAQKNLETRKTRLKQAESLLRVLAPQATLERGYTITTNEAGHILRTAEEIEEGAILTTQFSSGKISSEVVKKAV